MKIAAIALAAAGLVASGAALAQSAEDLIKKNGCAACHSNDKKIVGPAYVEVAAKYKGDAGAAAKGIRHKSKPVRRRVHAATFPTTWNLVPASLSASAVESSRQNSQFQKGGT